jgi:MoaA/NifB/PqqE/SkfB family radical SAM enzyme
MSNNFCRFLSNGFSLELQNYQINVKPCCWFKNAVPFDGPDTLKDLYNVDTWIPGCKICQTQEQSNIFSFRQASFDISPDIPDGKITTLDINLDFECNAACIMCNSKYSTLWSKELKRFKINHAPTDLIGKDRIDSILSSLDLSGVTRIKFFGGEPLFNDLHVKVLEYFPNPGNVEIWYTTNASIYPSQSVLDLWAKFKLVYFEASLDGIGKQFDYIRWPLKWDQVEKNLLRLKNEAPVNLLFRINHTLNPFNVFYYDRMVKWVDTYFADNRLGDKTEINIHPCWGEWDLAKTPTALRDSIASNSPIYNLLRNTPVNTDLSSIKEFIKQWEPRRKNNWKEVFPEIAKYFNLD